MHYPINTQQKFSEIIVSMLPVIMLALRNFEYTAQSNMKIPGTVI